MSPNWLEDVKENTFKADVQNTSALIKRHLEKSIVTNVFVFARLTNKEMREKERGQRKTTSVDLTRLNLS